MNSKSFVDLVAWQKAHELVLSIYRLTRAFPKDELFCLTSQMRRAAVSVPANIAEGFKRRGRQDKLRFLNIAQGSLEELRYYLIVTTDLAYGETQQCAEALDRVGKLLAVYIKAVARDWSPLRALCSTVALLTGFLS
ncbi:MAG TPA: four helix bundle protein [Chthoniobacterales bacterium]|nr:four helix bundle protein [Chthoniobacterales bacterium]